MRFLLPRPLHSWRESIGKIGIFVIGLLIATPSFADGLGDAKSAFSTLDKGDNDNCLSLYTQALASGALGPLDKADAYLNRAVCNDRKHHIRESLADNKAAIDLYTPLSGAGHPASDRAEALRRRGIVYYNLRKLDLARADFDAALALTPSSGELHRNRGDENRQDNKSDMHVLMAKPLAKPPPPGSYVDVTDRIFEYMASPFKFTLTQGEI